MGFSPKVDFIMRRDRMHRIDRKKKPLVRGTLFWGTLLGGPPNLLLGLGVILLYPILANRKQSFQRTGGARTVIKPTHKE
jgi:hypothetical protein